MIPHMYNSREKNRLEIVKHYLGSKDSIRKTAYKYHISTKSLCRWLRIYKKEGESAFYSRYKRAWNRTAKEIEKKIVLLKENHPPLTIRQAHAKLKKYGIKISQKSILGIWQRYGYSGHNTQDMTYDITEYCTWCGKTKAQYKQAEKLYASNNIEKAAEILNTIALLPMNDILPKLPDTLLTMQRKVDKYIQLFAEMPLSRYLSRTGRLYRECTKQQLNYLALRIGLYHVLALGWAIKPVKMLTMIEGLKSICISKNAGSRNSLFAFIFPLSISEGIAHAVLGNIKTASGLTKKSRALLLTRKHKPSLYMFSLGSLYSFLEEKKKAEYWYNSCLASIKQTNADREWLRKTVCNNLADIYASRCDHSKAINLLNDAALPGWRRRPRKLMYKSIEHLTNGRPEDAITYSTKTLSLLKKNDIRGNVFNINLSIASAYSSLGYKEKAKKVLMDILPWVRKTKIKKLEGLYYVLFSNSTNKILEKSKNNNIMPTVKTALLLRNNEYTKALQYAKQKGLMSSLYRYVFFFPEVVIKQIGKGKPTGLPKSMLRLPAFNSDVPVYYIRFLGSLVIHRNQKYLRLFLSPKECAFIINIALRIGRPKRSIKLNEILTNFWNNNQHPTSNLSHMLVRIRKALRISSHMLEISYRQGIPVLVNKGIYFITDYDEFIHYINQAKAFEKIGDWNSTKKDFLNAAHLVRGKPFEKMYDQWSDEIRRIILNDLEKEFQYIIASCMDNQDQRTAKRLFKKANKILQNTYKIKEIAARLTRKKAHQVVTV